MNETPESLGVVEADYVPNDEQLALIIEHLKEVEPRFRSKLEYLTLMGVATPTELGNMAAAAVAATRFLTTIQRQREQGKLF